MRMYLAAGRITPNGRSDLITAEVLWIVFGLKLIIYSLSR